MLAPPRRQDRRERGRLTPGEWQHGFEALQAAKGRVWHRWVRCVVAVGPAGRQRAEGTRSRPSCPWHASCGWHRSPECTRVPRRRKTPTPTPHPASVNSWCFSARSPGTAPQRRRRLPKAPWERHQPFRARPGETEGLPKPHARCRQRGPPGRSRLASGSSAPPHVPGAFKAGAAEAAARGPICSGAARGARDALQLVRGPGSARGAAVCWGLLLSTLKHGSGRGRRGDRGG